MPQYIRNNTICEYCRYFDWNVYQKSYTLEMVCSVFPKGIPQEIGAGHFDHHEPHPDDHGIQYERFRKLDDLPAEIIRSQTEESIDKLIEQYTQEIRLRHARWILLSPREKRQLFPRDSWLDLGYIYFLRLLNWLFAKKRKKT